MTTEGPTHSQKMTIVYYETKTGTKSPMPQTYEGAADRIDQLMDLDAGHERVPDAMMPMDPEKAA